MARRLTISYLNTEAGSGLVLAAAALAALILANSPLSARYFSFINHVITLQIGGFRESETVADWVKNGLMAIFFLVAGLQVKYEAVKGELANPRRLALPILGAVGGIVGPALIFLAVNQGPHGAPAGWPIGIATDFALALAAFAAVSRRLPSGLRLFLLTVALIDDICAVALIGVHYRGAPNFGDIAVVLVTLALLALMGRWRRAPFLFYAVGFVVVWAYTLHSGVSTCVGAVACAMTVPTGSRRPNQDSTLNYFIDSLHPYVAFGVLPLFAFVASGFPLLDMTRAELGAPLPLGVILALVIGKPLGVLAFCGAAVALKWARLPAGATWLEFVGVTMLLGVGFTLSLFIGALALPGNAVVDGQVRLGVIAGSALSAAAGAAILAFADRRRRATAPREAYG